MSRFPDSQIATFQHTPTTCLSNLWTCLVFTAVSLRSDYRLEPGPFQSRLRLQIPDGSVPRIADVTLLTVGLTSHSKINMLTDSF